MTCIVGLKHNNKVTIGADSAGSDSNFNISNRIDVKVFRVDDFIIGCTSSFRMIQLLRYSLKLPKIHDKDIFEYMCTDFINSVRTCFKDGGFLQKEKEEESGGTFLVAYKDRLFEIENDFQVAENYDDYNSVGCGSHYAKGSFYSTKKMKSIDRLKIALKTAQHHSAGVREPFIYEETKP